MEINRNEPCPCGSGKKYKKCCLQKQNVVQLNEVKEERFFQQKHRLVNMLDVFIQQKLIYNEVTEIENHFNQRSERKIEKQYRRPYVSFYIYFFHKFKNGLRGVEWFYQENHSKLTAAEKSMLETWIKLQLKLVQAIEVKDNVVIFEDLLTKDHYPVRHNKEIISESLPGYGTLGLLEQFEQTYYFNGARVLVGSQQLNNVVKKIAEIEQQTKLSKKEVLANYFPELLAVSLTKQIHSSPSVNSEDIPLLEQLGFTLETANKFYTADILEFYKEKTLGKSDSTVRKYRTTLYDLRELLERATSTSWDQCDYSLWKNLISSNYTDLFETMSKTQMKDFTSVFQAFMKKLDEQYETKLAKDVVALIKQLEPATIC